MRVWLSPDVVGYVPRSGPQLDQMTVGSVVQAARLASYVSKRCSSTGWCYPPRWMNVRRHSS
jgi:hypothetical protein